MCAYVFNTFTLLACSDNSTQIAEISTLKLANNGTKTDMHKYVFNY